MTDTTDTTNTTDTTTPTPTYTYSIDKAQNRQVAALHHIAAKNSARPVLDAVQVVANDDSLTFTITDGYRLVERTYQVGDGSPRDHNIRLIDTNTDDVVKVTVDSFILRDALNSVKTAIMVKFDVSTLGVTITSGGTTILAPAVDATPPNTDRLWKQWPISDAPLPSPVALSPVLLWGLARSTGRTNAKMTSPLVMSGSIVGDTPTISPIHVTMSGEQGWKAIIMQVKVN